MRGNHLPDRGLLSSQIHYAGLQTSQQFRAGFELQVEDRLQSLEGGLHRLVERPLGIDTVDDVNGVRHGTLQFPFGSEQVFPGNHLILPNITGKLSADHVKKLIRRYAGAGTLGIEVLLMNHVTLL